MGELSDDDARVLRSGASAIWTLWSRASPAAEVLVLVGGWTLAPFALASAGARVAVWESDLARAKALTLVASNLGVDVAVEHVPERDFIARLCAMSKRHTVVAADQAIDLSRRMRRRDVGELIAAMAGVCARDGQCFVVNRARVGAMQSKLMGLPKRGGPRFSSVYKGFRARFSSAAGLFLYPDLHSCEEVVDAPRGLPSTWRNRRWLAGLARLALHGDLIPGFACWAPDGGGILRELEHRLDVTLRLSPNDVQAGIRSSEMLFFDAHHATAGRALVRMPLNHSARDRLADAIAAAREAQNIEAIAPLVPTQLAWKALCGWMVHAETYCTGEPARRRLELPVNRAASRRAAAEVERALGAATLKHNPVDEHFFERHVGWRTRDLKAAYPCTSRYLDALDRWLRDRLLGRVIPTVRIHGDLTPNNLFVEPGSGRASGLIDWEMSLSDSLPFDLIHYLINEHRELTGRPWGELAAEAVFGGCLDTQARDLLNGRLREIGIESKAIVPLLIVYWLRGVRLRLELSGGTLAGNWRDSNFIRPLQRMAKELTDETI